MLENKSSKFNEIMEDANIVEHNEIVVKEGEVSESEFSRRSEVLHNRVEENK